ncbi:MAG: 4,5-DOPA dioxygenase extradiol [Alphaproteobacteria bacterium]|nr:4,5-DOPA dioxygenase extradiol [Alphaproteobacteria bacterium]
MTLPVLFLGHGSPMNAIEDNPFSRGWAAVAQRLPRPRAILCISAHWETRGLAIGGAAEPETIHDFFGFPQALFDVRYKAPGAPWLAQRVRDLVTASPAAPQAIAIDEVRGLDHGAWGVLLPMYPEADIPVVQLSLDRTLTPRQHLELGKALAPLRDEGMLVIGSGDIVHNLRVDFRRAVTPDWAARFNEQAKALIVSGNDATLAAYEGLGEDAALSINSAEHYLPLLYVLALRKPGDAVTFFNDTVFAAISMTSVVLGDLKAA